MKSLMAHETEYIYPIGENINFPLKNGVNIWRIRSNYLTSKLKYLEGIYIELWY